MEKLIFLKILLNVLGDFFRKNLGENVNYFLKYSLRMLGKYLLKNSKEISIKLVAVSVPKI